MQELKELMSSIVKRRSEIDLIRMNTSSKTKKAECIILIEDLDKRMEQLRKNIE